MPKHADDRRTFDKGWHGALLSVHGFLTYGAANRAGLDQDTVRQLTLSVEGMVESSAERIRDHGSLCPTKAIEGVTA